MLKYINFILRKRAGIINKKIFHLIVPLSKAFLMILKDNSKIDFII
jgi:hypothetical protein